jgi:hypothetical protein
MTKLSRSRFLAMGAGALVAGGAGAPRLAAHAPRARSRAGDPAPDLILVGGRVYTVDDALPRAQALAVKDGRFLAVGSDDEIRALAGPDTRVLEAGGRTVTPGFIDAHSHPAWGGIEELVNVNVDLRTIAGIQDALRARARTTAPGEWVLGFKYDDTKLRDGRPLTRQDLDAAVPDHPVKVIHRGGHTAVYNTRAFQEAGVTAETPDPEGGHIYREDGELTGLVAERANELFDDHIPSGTTRGQRQEGVELISRLMTAAGITSVHDAGVSPDYATAYQDAYDAGTLGFRVTMMPRGPTYEALKAAGMRTGLGDAHLRVGAAKFVADGSASERTMRMSTPYEGRPDDYGILTMTQAEIHEAVEEAHRLGFQVGIHANGDVAIDMVLNAYERVQERWPRPDPRHRIEHCTLVNDDLLRRIARVGAIPTPFYTYVYYHGDKWGEYGEAKLRRMFAHASFLEHGIPVAGASDYIPGPFEPLMALQSMVTRTDWKGRTWGPNQRISVEEALRVATLNGAYASFEEEIKGSITPGKLADFVVLAEDPHTVEPGRIKDIEVVRTVVGGRTVHPHPAD